MNDMRANVATGNQWVRLAYMVFFCVCLYVASLVVPIIVIAQFLFAAITGSDNEQLRRFSWSLTLYIKETLLYLTYNSDHKTFPFDDWPGTEELDRRVHPGALDIPVPDHPDMTASNPSSASAAAAAPVAATASTAVVAEPLAAPPESISAEPVVEPAVPLPSDTAAGTAAPYTGPGLEPVAATAFSENVLEPHAVVDAGETGEVPLVNPDHGASSPESVPVVADDEARRDETVDPAKL